MSIAATLREPTNMHMYAGIATASIGVAMLVLLRIHHVRANNKDIYKPSVLIDEAFGHDEDDPGEIPLPPPGRKGRKFRAGKGARKLSRITTLIVVLIALAISFAGSAYALHNYTIVSNWRDGTSRALIHDYVGAIVCFKKALRADPGLRHSHFLIGDSLFRSSRVRSAIEELEIAANGEHSDPDPSAYLGDAYLLLNRPQEALKAYRKAAEIDKQSAAYQIAIASCLEQMNNLDEAYRAYEYAIKLEPDNFKAHMKLGALLVNHGHLDEGVAHCKRAIALAPNEVLPHNTLATAYAEYQMYNEAIVEFRKAISLNKKSPIPFYDYGATLERLSEWDRALEQFRSCVSMTPQNIEERQTIDKAKVEIARIQARLVNKR